MVHPRRRIIQFTSLLLISISGTLLGLSQGTWQLTLVAIVGGLVGWLLVDTLGWFHLKGWAANIASILILIYAISEFYDSSAAMKLISVGRLLIYLQTVLMFQEKTPRLYWQILVLTLLQIVVAAIFNLNFEGGLLFLAYFAVAGAMMMLQCDLTQWSEVQRVNRKNLALARQRLDGDPDAEGNAAPACMVFQPQVPGSYRRMLGHLIPWLVVAFLFSTVLFYNLPRTDSAWLGPGIRKVSATGASYDLDLRAKGLISESGRLVFRATFIDPRTKQKKRLAEPPYFRGMALSRWVVENGITDWRAPYDAVYSFSYQRPNRLPRGYRNYLVQQYSIEATTDPLLFSVFPIRRIPETTQEIEFCREISALTRRRRGDHAEMASYKYELAVLTDMNGRPISSWPYQAEASDSRGFTMDNNPGEYQGLTYLEPERYPRLIKTADEIAQRVGRDNPLALAKALNDYFTPRNGFKYTLDFRAIPWKDELDPIEDFSNNHRTGHCQLYASSLAIMLRSQGIPARIVIGYYGAEYNEVTDAYMVREKHAHAWVEAYIPPEFCSASMNAMGGAGPGGAWIRLDPTAGVYRENTQVVNGQGLELARTLWQDYVLGMDEDTQPEPFDVNSSQLLGLLDLSNWQRLAQTVADRVENRPAWRLGLLVIVLGSVAVFVFRLYRSQKRPVRVRTRRPVSRIRKMIGEALFWLSPELGSWVMGDAYVMRVVPFYEKAMAILQKTHGLVRDPGQTQREFAQQVAQHFSDHPAGRQIAQSIAQLTDLFYSIRFGLNDLEPARLQQIELQVRELETELKQIDPVAKTALSG